MKNIFKRYFSEKLSKQDLIGFRNLLKIVNHKSAEPPILDINSTSVRYFVRIPHIDLIIDESSAEIVNSKHVWKLQLNDIVYERIIEHIKLKKQKQIEDLEEQIRGKKLTILEGLYNKIR